jgi:hypothetical protein
LKVRRSVSVIFLIAALLKADLTNILLVGDLLVLPAGKIV